MITLNFNVKWNSDIAKDLSLQLDINYLRRLGVDDA